MHLFDNQYIAKTISCSGLTSITIPEGVTSIGSYAFYGCSGLNTLVCDIETPLSLPLNVFTNVDITNCMLIVPKGCVEAYKAAEVWKDFENIREAETVAIDAVTANGNASGAIYNLRGQKVYANFRGIVIMNGKKVVR